MRAKVNPDTCAGCGICEEVCPEVFEIGDTGLAIVKVDPVPPEAEESCRAAAEQCPTDAIDIEE